MKGADDQYTRLFDAEYPGVRRTLQVMVGDVAVAEDLTQDAFVQLLLHWRKVSGYDRPGAWVRRVAIRLAVKHMRREGQRRLLEPTASWSSQEQPADPDLERALATLPAKQRAVVALFYYEDRPMKEVAELLGMSESTGFVHLHRARRRLAALLGEVDADVVG